MLLMLGAALGAVMQHYSLSAPLWLGIATSAVLRPHCFAPWGQQVERLSQSPPHNLGPAMGQADLTLKAILV